MIQPRWGERTREPTATHKKNNFFTRSYPLPRVTEAPFLRQLRRPPNANGVDDQKPRRGGTTIASGKDRDSRTPPGVTIPKNISLSAVVPVRKDRGSNGFGKQGKIIGF
jgi:hypothetical protein